MNKNGSQTPGTISVTIDISGMYTNIPWDEGMQAFKEAMDKRADKRVPSTFLLTLLMLVLSCNVFTFNGNLSLQLFGVAMGTRVAPTFACLFMGWLERILLSTWTGRQPNHWCLYIDDIWFLWSGTKEELLEFITLLNSVHPTIKFKCKEVEHFSFATRTVNFLDMTVFMDENNFIETPLYTKPGKVCQYLLPSSCHPAHITRNIPFSLAYHLLRIESVRENLLSNLERLREDLVNRRYNLESINLGFQRVLNLDRNDCLQKVISKGNNRIPLIIPFHKALPNISNVLTKHWKILVDKHPVAKKFLPAPPMVCHTRDRNLRDILVKAVLPPPSESRPRRAATSQGFHRCGKRGDCSLCSHSVNTSEFTLYDGHGKSTQVNIPSRIL